MTESRRFASWGLLSLLASLLSGCVVEPPYPPEATPPAPSAPLSVRDVITLVDEGFAEDPILIWVRAGGLDARPTTAELQELRQIGASDQLIAALRTGGIAYPVEILPGIGTVPWIYSTWPPFHPFPGLPPFPCGHWVEGKRWFVPPIVEPLP